MIVEDNPKDLKLVRDVLSAKGHEIIAEDTPKWGLSWRWNGNPI